MHIMKNEITITTKNALNVLMSIIKKELIKINKIKLINNFLTTEAGLGAADAKTVADLKAEIDANSKIIYTSDTVYGIAFRFFKCGKIVDVNIEGKLTRTLTPADGWVPFIILDPSIWISNRSRCFIVPISDYNTSLFNIRLDTNGNLDIRSSTAELEVGELVRVNFTYIALH